MSPNLVRTRCCKSPPRRLLSSRLVDLVAVEDVFVVVVAVVVDRCLRILFERAVEVREADFFC